ncbi:hypothetical protein LXL04_006456 [Taraxacum kok-saghyz]
MAAIEECQKELSEARALVEEAERSLVGDTDTMMTETEREAMLKNKERFESVKAPSIYAIVGTIASLQISIAQASGTSQLILPSAITLISCALFGVTFRYAVRRDLDNFQLKTGTSAAFGFVKGLATRAGGPPMELEINSNVAYVGMYGMNPSSVCNHRRKLQNSTDCPCLDVGKPKRPVYIPLELCDLISLQRYTKSLSNLQRASLVEKSMRALTGTTASAGIRRYSTPLLPSAVRNQAPPHISNAYISVWMLLNSFGLLNDSKHYTSEIAIDMSQNREWMYTKRITRDGRFNLEFTTYVLEFLEFAYTNATNIKPIIEEGVEVLQIRCPCKKCKNVIYNTREIVYQHLCTSGFMKDYSLWYAHGELYSTQGIGRSSNPIPSKHMAQEVDDGVGEFPRYEEMVIESMHQPEAPYYQQGSQHPNEPAQTFFHLMNQASEPLWDGCQKASTLSVTTGLLNWKSEFNISAAAFDKLLPLFKDSLPAGAKLPDNFYETKKMLKPLKLPSQRIHVCKNHCMLFNGHHSDVDHCLVCNESRYTKSGGKVPKLVMTYMPIGPRLQRLFYSKKTAQHLTWHSDHPIDPDKMIHPSESPAWKHFDTVYPDFAQEARNVRLGLCTDGFSPNTSNVSPYSCWPVFITVYNLPPWLDFKHQYIMLPLIIPGNKSPGQNLDVFLQPLVDELKMLFSNGIETYDAHRRVNFQMRAVLLWTISDFPAYAMLSGWSTQGYLACPYCSDKSGSSRLEKGRKTCWFDCHRKYLRKGHPFKNDKVNFKKNQTVKEEIPVPYPTGDEIWETVQNFSTVYDGTPYGPNYVKPQGFGVSHNWVKKSIFWELPYWRHLLIRHNLDVMHIEKNVFENLFHTIMGTPKTKDKLHAREDMKIICDRPVLEPTKEGNGKSKIKKGDYTLGREEVKQVCAWLKNLKFPDGYASNIANCVNVKDGSFYAFKSHDCHVFMQRLLPLAIRGFVPKMIYEAVTEMSMFFRVLCSRTLHIQDLSEMKRSIVQTVCKLEKIFPPGFFDSMEHLVIHLVDEALLGGPVSHRWMYQYERKLGIVKRRIRNKARVEGSIANEHLVNELATYCSLYFEPTIETRHNREPRNFAPQHYSSLSGESPLSVFAFPSRRLYEKGGKKRLMSREEHHKAHTYILLNCPEIAPYIREFEEVAPGMHPGEPVLGLKDKYFALWFDRRVRLNLDGSLTHLKVLARKPELYAECHNGYFVNGYKFHTRQYGNGRVTHNFGVCVRGEIDNANESDYYGLVEEILEIKYYGIGRSTVVLFKCTWFDNEGGVVVNKNKLVDVKHKSRLKSNDPFCLASQAEQVFYTPYPKVTKDTKDIWAVVKTKPRGVFEVTEDENEADGFFQIDERFAVPHDVTRTDRVCLASNTNTYEEISDVDSEGFEDEQHEEDVEDEDDGDELVYSDHDSDYDEEFSGSVDDLGGVGPAPPDSWEVADLDATMSRLMLSSKRDNNSDSTTTTSSSPPSPPLDFASASSTPIRSSSGGVLENLGAPFSMFNRGHASSDRRGSAGGTSAGNFHRRVYSPESSGHGSLHRRSHNSTTTPRRHGTAATPRHVTRPIGTGAARSNSWGDFDPVTGLADSLPDHGVFRHFTPHGSQMIGGRGGQRADDYYSQLDDHGRELPDDREHSIHTPHYLNAQGTTSGSDVVDFQDFHLPLITLDGMGFADHTIHRYIGALAFESLDHAWPTFTHIPKEVIDEWFARFGTRYRWIPEEAEGIRTNFENILAERFRDRMSGSKRKSKEMAIKAGHDIREINDSFPILRNFAPRPIHSSVWNLLIDYWDTPGWKKISLAAKRNRNSGENDGVTPARHTGGSIGVTETRKKLKKKMGKEPLWHDVFCQTRLTPKSKEKYFKGDLEGLRYITPMAEHAHVAYKKALEEKYGDDPTQQTDDPELWETTQLQMQGGKGKGRIYGIGSADLHFAVSGTYSFWSTSSSAKGSQAEVLRLRQQVEDLKNSQTQMQENFDLKLKEKESEMDARMQIRQYETDVRQSRVEQQLQELSTFVNLLKQSGINLPNGL